MLNVPCHEHCPLQNSSAACLSLNGCLWNNVTNSCYIGEGQITNDAWIGIILSLLGDIIINVGMNCMKYAHNINIDPETGKPLKHFTSITWWWFGILGIIGGEVGNLIAYGYAPAAIVTPIGSIGVVTNVLITTRVLKEPLTKLNIFGVLCVVGGIVVVVLFAPKAVITFSSRTVWKDVLFTRNFGVYLAVFFGSLAVMLPVSRKYGKKSVLIYIIVCAIIASLTIVCAKSFSTLLINSSQNGIGIELLSPWPYVFLIVMVITAVLSMSYVNKAMMVFDNSQVVPTYFSLFTTASVGAVGWVYHEFDCFIDLTKGILFLVGIVTAMIGVFLVQQGIRYTDNKICPDDETCEGSVFSRESSCSDENMLSECSQTLQDPQAAPLRCSPELEGDLADSNQDKMSDSTTIQDGKDNCESSLTKSAGNVEQVDVPGTQAPACLTNDQKYSPAEVEEDGRLSKKRLPRKMLDTTCSINQIRPLPPLSSVVTEGEHR
mmetsp:Transcript_17476/g.39575  ORF Transcript_17476/g.39575 Transcript_17476/m.39575 type:complete len:490 (-) Transcript_17476:242-1711(-)